MRIAGVMRPPAALLISVMLALPFVPSTMAAPRPAAKRLLYLTHTAGYRHDVVPLSKEIVPQLGRASGLFEATVTEDVSLLSAEGLRPFDAVLCFTTGELPVSDGQKQALLDFVAAGGGFAGVHSATDTFYKWPAYGELIGGYFNDHPWHQEVTIRVEDRAHPAARHLGSSFRMYDEIYQFKDWSRDRVHVLLSLDVSSVDLTRPNVHRTDKDFALAWTREHGQGRVFYTALGHEPEVWRDERFQQHLIGGLRWIMKVE